MTREKICYQKVLHSREKPRFESLEFLYRCKLQFAKHMLKESQIYMEKKNWIKKKKKKKSDLWKNELEENINQVEIW